MTLAPSGQLLAAALDIGMEHNRSVYDALYVALALREGCRLVTADRRLYQALEPVMPATMLWVEDIQRFLEN